VSQAAVAAELRRNLAARCLDLAGGDGYRALWLAVVATRIRLGLERPRSLAADGREGWELSPRSVSAADARAADRVVVDD
jgi:hypothetical protein